MALSDRIRPDVEAAPWVIEEVKKLETKLENYKRSHDRFQRYLKDSGIEIERLKAENARVWELHNHFLNSKMTNLQKEIHELRSENARYREALERVMYESSEGDKSTWIIASKALKGDL